MNDLRDGSARLAETTGTKTDTILSGDEWSLLLKKWRICSMVIEKE